MRATQDTVDDQPVVVRRVWPAQPHTPGAARKLIAESLAIVGLVDHPVVEDLQLAVTEAVTNAVEHAYAAIDPDVEATVELTLRIEPDQVSVVIADHGRWREAPATARVPWSRPGHYACRCGFLRGPP